MNSYQAGLRETHVKVAILGAGPTGLGAAWRLSRRCASAETLGKATATLPFLLIEKSHKPGGRAASFTTPEGFTFDYGGHVLFPHAEYEEFARLLDQVIPHWHASVPVRGVWIANRLIPTPVQRNIHRLPFATMAACLWGLLRRKTASGPFAPSRGRATEPPVEPNLHEHLYSQFGEPMTRHVMGPLNRKMWAHSLAAMGSDWSSHRSGSREKNIPQVSVRDILCNFLLRRDEPGWTSSTVVRYPMHGGVGVIWDRIFQLIPEPYRRLNSAVAEVDTQRKRLHMEDGSMIRYEQLVSSLPLDILLRRLRDQPDLRARASEFRAAQVQVFGFGLHGPMPPILKGVHAVNIPAPNVPFWRMNIPSNFSPGTVPQDTDAWSILCEISMPPASKGWHDKAGIEAILRQMGFIPPAVKVISSFTSVFEHGYPVPFLGREELLNDVQGKLEQLDIYSRGRFGGWRYEVSNQDHAFMQGVEVIDRLRDGKPEYTYRKTWQQELIPEHRKSSQMAASI